MKLIMTKGLPASGKSTWAKEQVLNDRNTIRINKDDLREMLHTSVHSKGKEAFVLATRDYLAEKALKAGQNVIIDDTNFNPIHEKRLKQIALECNAKFEIKDFTNIPLEECIKRDLKRGNSVGEQVIRSMYNQYLKPVFPVIIYNEHLPDAIICDLDGTLALFGNKNPYDRDFINDELNKPVATILEQLGQNDLIITSGRNAKYYADTVSWLEVNNISYNLLLMRKEDDFRKDSVIKQEMYEGEIKDKYNVLAVFDDRDQVVEMWRNQGLTCLQVAEGNF